MLTKLTAHVYQLGGVWGAGAWGANVFLLLDRDLTLVDTGFKGRAGHIIKELKRLGYSPSDIANFISFGHGSPLVHKARLAVTNFIEMHESKYQRIS